MPFLRCRRSLDREMAAANDKTAVKCPQSPKKKTKKRKAVDSIEGTPAKKLRVHATSPVKSAKDSLGTRSFYGSKKSNYVSPERRKHLRDKSSEHRLQVIDVVNSNVIVEDLDLVKKVKNEKRGKAEKSKKKIVGNKTASTDAAKAESEFVNRYGKRTTRSQSTSSQQSVSPNEKENKEAEASSNTKEERPARRFFRHRSSPGEKAKMTKPQVMLRKGYKLTFDKSKTASGINTSAESSQSKSKKTPKSQKRELSSDLLASLSTIKQLQTDCKPDNLCADSDLRNTSPVNNNPHSQDLYKADDTESLLTSICDEIDADNFEDMSSDSTHHNGSVSTEQTNECLDDNKSSSPNSGDVDSVMLLSEASSEVTSTGMSTPKGSPTKDKKLFPIFRSSPRFKKPGSVTSSPSSSLPATPDTASNHSDRKRSLSTKGSARNHVLKSLRDRDGKEQMILDFGQRLGGPIQCEVCGMTYTEGEPSDETTHSRFHQTIVSALKFPGWKKERVCQENQDASRIIVITADDKFAKKKVEGIRQIVDNELGFVVERRKLTAEMKTFLYISQDKKVIGCCIAEGIQKGYRMIGDNYGNTSTRPTAEQTWCCSTMPETAKCGISRIWVISSERRKNIASQLLDCVRFNFLMGYPLKKTDLAFSDPTPAGRQFATKYTGSCRFLVYNHNNTGKNTRA